MHGARWSQSLPNDVQAEIIARTKVRRFRDGAMLFSEGDANTGLHHLLDGRIHITGTAHDGALALMAILRPGDWTGFLANLDGGCYALDACCVTDCEVATLSPQSVREIFETSVTRYKLLASPELIVARRNYRYLVEQQGGPPLQRLAYRLLDLASGPHGQPGDGSGAPVQISQEQLGSAARLSRQKVNALLQILVDRGLVSISRNSVFITDEEAMKRLALWQR